MQKQILTLLVVFAGHALGGDLKKGDILNVNAGSLWFQTSGGLSVYQRFATEISPQVLAKYREVVLQCREAWEFTAVQKVKVLFYNDPLGHQVQVEMLGPGSKKGTDWYIDTKDIQ
jgi:hypothetical protein